MKHIIVTEPNTKPEIKFAFDHLKFMHMAPKFISAELAGISTARNAHGNALYVVVRPISDAEETEFIHATPTRTTKSRGAIIDL